MEKQDNKKESNPTIHPTLSIYLSGNFTDQPVNSFNPNLSSNGGESTKWNPCVYLEKLIKNKRQISSVAGGRLYIMFENFLII